MRKTSVFAALFCAALLASCGKSQESAAPVSQTGSSACSDTFQVGSAGDRALTLKAKVLSDNVRNLSSGNAGTVQSLSCEKGKKVRAGDVIAKIVPDFSDVSVKNQVSQKESLSSQLSNTREILASTNSNFATQLGSLQTQKSNLENQISILEDTLAKIEEQRGYGVSDIDKQLDLLNIQLSTLDTQIADLTASKAKLQDSKKADLAKLDSNLANARNQSKALVANALTVLDETYGISDKNREKNDAYDTYLGAKDSSLKNSVVSGWSTANAAFMKFDSMDSDAQSAFLGSVADLLGKAKESVKGSVVSTNFSQTTIDSLFSTIVQFENGILSAKGGFDTVGKSFDTVRNTYDTQILSLDTQINGAQNSKKSVEANVENVKSNKLGTYVSSLDLQKNQSVSSLATLKTNLSGVNSQIESLQSQKEIQINQLNNQIAQLENSLTNVSNALVAQTVVSDVAGTVKEKSATEGNKVAAGATVCQIVPDESGLKIQAYSPDDLPLPLPVSFEIDGKKYSSELKAKLSYQDPVTQNSIYETASSAVSDGKTVGLSSVVSEGRVLDVSATASGSAFASAKVSVPVNFITNTIGGFKAKVKAADGSVSEKPVVLGDLDSDRVEVRSGLSSGDVLCR